VFASVSVPKLAMPPPNALPPEPPEWILFPLAPFPPSSLLPLT
jgi:hypothetical protein